MATAETHHTLLVVPNFTTVSTMETQNINRCHLSFHDRTAIIPLYFEWRSSAGFWPGMDPGTTVKVVMAKCKSRAVHLFARRLNQTLQWLPGRTIRKSHPKLQCLKQPAYRMELKVRCLKDWNGNHTPPRPWQALTDWHIILSIKPGTQGICPLPHSSRHLSEYPHALALAQKELLQQSNAKYQAFDGLE